MTFSCFIFISPKCKKILYQHWDSEMRHEICTNCSHSGSLGVLEKSHLCRVSHHANCNLAPCTLKHEGWESHHANCNPSLCTLKPKTWRFIITWHTHTYGPSVCYIKYQPMGKEYSNLRVFLLSNRNNKTDFLVYLGEIEIFYLILRVFM